MDVGKILLGILGTVLYVLLGAVFIDWAIVAFKEKNYFLFGLFLITSIQIVSTLCF